MARHIAAAIVLTGGAGCAGSGEDSGDSKEPVDDTAFSAALPVAVLAGGGGDLVSLDPEDGSEGWRVNAGSIYHALHAGQGLLFSLEHAQYQPTLAHSTEDGAEQWRAVGLDDDLSPGPTLAGGVLITGWDRDTIAGIDITAPDVPLWTFVSAGAPVGEGTLVDGLYVFGDAQGRVYGLDPATGAVTWETELGGAVVGGVVSKDGAVYTAVAPAAVVSLNAADGELRWEADLLPGAVWGCVDVVNGQVYAATDYALDNVFALNADTGAVAWRGDVVTYGEGGGVRATEHGVLVPSGGLVHLLGAADGELAWTLSVGTAALAVPAVWGGTAWFSGRDTFSRVDLATGTIEWWLDDDAFDTKAAPVLLLDDGTAVNPFER